MWKEKTDVCPTQNKPYTISIEYLDVSSSSGAHYIKGNYECQYNEFGDMCDLDCPLYESAPKEL